MNGSLESLCVQNQLCSYLWAVQYPFFLPRVYVGWEVAGGYGWVGGEEWSGVGVGWIWDSTLAKGSPPPPPSTPRLSPGSHMYFDTSQLLQQMSKPGVAALSQVLPL